MWILMPNFEIEINSPDSSITRVYHRLAGWDGQWYFHIAKFGYVCKSLPQFNNPNICNVGFFPFVPFASHLIAQTGVPLFLAVSLISQIFWVGTISILIYFLHLITGRIQYVGSILIVVFVISFPGTFYYLTPYSESALTFFLLCSAVLSWRINENPKWTLSILLIVVCFLSSLVKATGIIAILFSLDVKIHIVLYL